MEDIIAARRHLHQNPEISGAEKSTAAFVVQYLRDYSSPDEIHTDIGGHGVIAIYNSKCPGQSVLFRAELDALPIHELNNFPHVSCVDSVSHKCGHDGHMATLLGLSVHLKNNKPNRGMVI